MKRNRTGYYIKEGFSSVVNHGFMSFASVCIIVACLIIMGSFSLLALNVNSIIDDFEDENVVLAFIDDSLSQDQAMALESQVKAVSNVTDAVFITRDQAYESFVGKYEDKSLFKDLDSSVLRHRFAVYLDDVAYTAETQAKLGDIPGIAYVNANLDIARGFVTVRNIVSGVSIVLVLILLVVSLFIMSNTVKLTTFERREEIAIMKMVGATNAFIRWPFVLEGFILGIIGSLLAYVAQWGIYTFITGKIIGSYSSMLFAVIPFSAVAVPMLIVFVVIGFGVGVAGSALAIKNYLKV